ncbi:MAG: ABC transporter permease [Candidatus Omnitrophota bacterium]|nr:ABC transporter permease [Candidatus Omnitrophota bacterium]
MMRFLLKRFVGVLPVLFFLPLITFVVMHFVPGNYFDSLRLNPQISPETIARYEAMYHLDQPVLVQFFYWLKHICTLDFGYSFAYKQPVLDLLLSRLGNTFLLTGAAFLLAWLAAVPAGLLAAFYRDGFCDRLFRLVAYLGLAIPNFFLCLVLLYLASRWGPLPLGGMRSVGHADLSAVGKVWDIMRHMAIPVFVLSLSSFAYLFRLMRSQTLEVVSKDFVFYLRASRVSEAKILFKHIGRNAINPLVTLFGLELPALFSGAALVEIFTGWPGLGQVMLQAVRTQDLFLVLGNMVMIAVILVIGNLLADILLAVMDPRIRLGRTN